ncbi:hypothetical protein SEA_AXYM_24 [Gordonia phage Axym]|uniref:Uncharacterized protein n=4 Tax=Emalynvirus cozz TaxID=2560490 RepID=A0A4Y5NZ71_9CAUD|nr:hypothetical protein BH767_gp24 [Gordonia phage Cozz]ANA85730.1 hypothetical protein PBI_COZZ_24 [Gordonia phage Cozz]QCW22357.1 hypothetical protein SEA_AGATHA_24 [Gordonia phage Agatha]QGH75891.1 hypothetical protein SEA_AXYM_24 [Gordonia phage Axym]QOP65282.1 membrane protein [Gordonia phage Burnsey]
MFTAASAPMWVAIIALLGTVLSPIIQGRINKNSPVSKADAAERFTRIAAGVAEDYDELREELREIKPLLQELIRLLDQTQCADTEHTHRIRTVIEKLREKMY